MLLSQQCQYKHQNVAQTGKYPVYLLCYRSKGPLPISLLSSICSELRGLIITYIQTCPQNFYSYYEHLCIAVSSRISQLKPDIPLILTTVQTHNIISFTSYEPVLHSYKTNSVISTDILCKSTSMYLKSNHVFMYVL